MMAYRLREDLHWCVTGGRAIFLDVRLDRYFALPDRTQEAFLLAAAGSAADPGDLELLVARGMLFRDPEGPGINGPARAEPVTGDLVGQPSAWPGMAALSSALAAEALAAWTVRRRSLHHIVRSIGHPAVQARSRAGAEARLREIASAAAAAALLTRATDRCLVRALAVHSRCRGLGLATRLLFGVRTHPFGAHCWVQSDGEVVVGDFEQARLYTPILVLG